MERSHDDTPASAEGIYVEERVTSSCVRRRDWATTRSRAKTDCWDRGNPRWRIGPPLATPRSPLPSRRHAHTAAESRHITQSWEVKGVLHDDYYFFYKPSLASSVPSDSYWFQCEHQELILSTELCNYNIACCVQWQSSWHSKRLPSHVHRFGGAWLKKKKVWGSMV